MKKTARYFWNLPSLWMVIPVSLVICLILGHKITKIQKRISCKRLKIFLSGLSQQKRKLEGSPYILSVRNIRLRGLQYIGATKSYFQYSGKEWREKVIIKPGFLCHMRVYQMDWEPLVYRDTCSKIKQKTCYWYEGAPMYWSRGSNIMESGPQYWSPSIFFPIRHKCLNLFCYHTNELQ